MRPPSFSSRYTPAAENAASPRSPSEQIGDGVAVAAHRVDMVGHAPAGHALVVIAAKGVVQRDMRDARLLPEADFLAPVLFGAVPVEVQTSRPTEAGSRPSASTRRRSLSNSATALGPGGSDSMIQPSPHFAIRCSVTSMWPPNHSGILRRGGRGLMPASGRRCHLPSNVT